MTEDIRDGDCRIVESTFNQLIDWICALNFGDAERPKFVLHEAEEYGTSELAQRDQMLYQMGARFSADYFKRAYGLQDKDLQGVEMPAEHGSADFAEHDIAEDFEQAVSPKAAPQKSSLHPDLARQGQDLTARFLGSLHNGATPEQVLHQLTHAYPHADDAALQNELARLIFLADLVGRLEVQGELKAGAR